MSKVRKVNWTLALVMTVAFGWLGVDRFIMGQIVLGILKLITFGGLGIWWLVDLIRIASKDKYRNVQWVNN